MESFIFAVNAVLPLILMALLGYFLRRINILSEDMPKGLNKMLFRAILPCMMFKNVYDIEGFGDIGFGYIAYAVVAIFIVSLIAIPCVIASSSKESRRGVLLQSVFRSNFALVGVSLATSLCGDRGAGVAALLAAFAVPIFNVMAVIALSIFSDNKGKASIKSILLDIIKNPLIVSVLSAVAVIGVRALFVKWGIEWRLSDVEPLFKVLDGLSDTATPIALIALGAQFKFSAIGGMRREIIFAVISRLVVVPLVALSVAYFFFDFEAVHFAAFIALFATPVAVSSVPMTQEMGGDVELAGQVVVWSTAISGFTIFLFTFVLKLLGVF